MIKYRTAFALTCLLSYQSASANYIEMSGIWTGDVVHGEGTRKIYTVRTSDGYYFSRHEYYNEGKLTRWIQNYGVWGQNATDYWAEIIVFASDKRFKSVHDCQPPKFTYKLTTQNGNMVSYTADTNHTEYTMEKLDSLPVDFIKQQPLRQALALRAIKDFKQKCRLPS